MKLTTLSDIVIDNYTAARARIVGRNEAERAVAYWAGLRSYHEITDVDPTGHERSRFAADELIGRLGAESVLEIGTNTGRNLAVIKATYPHVRVAGTDVNVRAIAYGHRLHPEIEFKLQDANRWDEAPKSWDAVLTMSVLDHIPDNAVGAVAANIVATARKFVMAVELWDGRHGYRGRYKYSRDTRGLFERHGAKTILWQESPGQYDRERSLLWAYIGSVAPA